MPESSTTYAETARENESVILRAVARVSQKVVAETVGVSDSTVSRMLSDGPVNQTSRFLAAAGLKVVPIEAQWYEPEYIKSLQVLAARCLTKETTQ